MELRGVLERMLCNWQNTLVLKLLVFAVLKNVDLVKSLGADKVVDYTKEDFTIADERYDIIFDTVGKSSFNLCNKALKTNGKYITTVMSLKVVIQALVTKLGNNKKVIFAMSLKKTEALKFIKTLIEEGKIRTVIDKQFSLEELAIAHEYVEKGHKIGNVVISII